MILTGLDSESINELVFPGASTNHQRGISTLHHSVDRALKVKVVVMMRCSSSG